MSLGVVRSRRAANDPSVARKILIGLMVAAALAGAGWVFLSGHVKSIADAGKQSIEAWCGKQLLALAADHLNATLHFDKLVYKFPKTVQLTRVTLTDQNIVVISADAITIEFAGIPASGAPIEITEEVPATATLLERQEIANKAETLFTNKVYPTMDEAIVAATIDVLGIPGPSGGSGSGGGPATVNFTFPSAPTGKRSSTSPATRSV